MQMYMNKKHVILYEIIFLSQFSLTQRVRALTELTIDRNNQNSHFNVFTVFFLNEVLGILILITN